MIVVECFRAYSTIMRLVSIEYCPSQWRKRFRTAKKETIDKNRFSCNEICDAFDNRIEKYLSNTMQSTFFERQTKKKHELLACYMYELKRNVAYCNAQTKEQYKWRLHIANITSTPLIMYHLYISARTFSFILYLYSGYHTEWKYSAK